MTPEEKKIKEALGDEAVLTEGNPTPEKLSDILRRANGG